jgi:hypothetical protein
MFESAGILFLTAALGDAVLVSVPLAQGSQVTRVRVGLPHHIISVRFCSGLRPWQIDSAGSCYGRLQHNSSCW